jgi:hypothetical protein
MCRTLGGYETAEDTDAICVPREGAVAMLRRHLDDMASCRRTKVNPGEGEHTILVNC